MNIIVYLLIIAIFLLGRSTNLYGGYLNLPLPVLPRPFTWAAELLSLLVVAVIALRLVIQHRLTLESKYILLIIAYLTVMLSGIIWNDVPAFSIFVALRAHLKFVPFFLLPAVYTFSQKEFVLQIRFLFCFLLLQIPVAIFQKIYFTRIGITTGDAIAGTVALSGTLSILMVCSMAVLFAFYLRKRLSMRSFLTASLLLFIPTTINETKLTIVILPLALMLPALLSEGYISSQKLRNMIKVGFSCIVFFNIFIPIYNYTVSPARDSRTIDQIFQDSNYLESYLYKGSQGKKNDDIRRFDEIALAFEHISKEFGTALFGRGIGVTIRSYLEGLDNKKPKEIQYRTSSIALSFLLWEVGFLGLLVYAIFFFLLYRDTVLLSRFNDIFGDFALGWSAVVPIMSFCLFYTNQLESNVLNLLFWYFSGLLASRAFAVRRLRALVAHP